MIVTARLSTDYTIRGEKLELRKGRPVTVSAEIGQLLIERGFADAAGAAPATEEAPSRIDDILAGKVNDIARDVAEGIHDDALEEIEKAESAGKNRKGIHEAIAARREVLDAE